MIRSALRRGTLVFKRVPRVPGGSLRLQAPVLSLRESPDVGCSYWTTGSFRGYVRRRDDAALDDLDDDDLFGNTSSGGSNRQPRSDPDEEDIVEIRAEDESPENEAPPSSTLVRPRLPTSIKKLNRLLSRHEAVQIREEDLEEQFIKGRGPGGQAINKTNSNVSLLHKPTGIRIFAQPTRMREENRKAARKLLQERLDALRAAGKFDEVLQSAKEGAKEQIVIGEEEEAGLSKKELRKREEKAIAGVYSKSELRAEKERVRKRDREKKAKRKRRKKEEEKERERLGVIGPQAEVEAAVDGEEGEDGDAEEGDGSREDDAEKRV